MDNLHIGSIITDANPPRDAIHVAVAPAVAGQELYPAQHVGVIGGRATATGAPHLGIVDPFLGGPVLPEQRFWVFLYPGSITSLRHHWEHPAFAAEEAAVDRGDSESKEASELWLRRFVETADCPGYDTLIAAAAGGKLEDLDYYGAAYRNDGEYLFFNGRDAHGEIPPEFWDHVENVTGQRIGPDKRPGYFSCSC